MKKETKTYHFKIECGKISITIGDEFFNCFFHNKNGSCYNAITDAVKHLVKEIIELDNKNWKKRVKKALSNIRCINHGITEGIKYTSCFDLIGGVLENE